jgi:membrane protease YdiL (CAAX protease family)
MRARDDPFTAPDRETLAFLTLAVGLSWAVWLPAAAGVVSLPGGTVLTAGAFGPPVAAVVVTAATGGSVRGLLGSLTRWRVRPRWYGVALGVTVVVVGVQATGFALLGGTLAPSVLPERLAVYPVLLVAMLTLGGGQEELGWRGYALPRLQATYGPAGATLLLGAVWAAWHWPLFFVDGSGYGALSPAVHGATIVAMSVLMTWLYNVTGGSVLLPMLGHASVNAAGSLTPVTGSVVTSSAGELAALQLAGVAVVAGLVVAVGGRSLADGDGPVTTGGRRPADGSPDAAD